MRILVPLLAVLATGCASYSHFDIDPDDASAELREGDVVRIERFDSTSAYIKITSISDAEVSGSSRTNIFLSDISIPFSQIVSITLIRRDSLESELPTIFAGILLSAELSLSSPSTPRALLSSSAADAASVLPSALNAMLKPKRSYFSALDDLK